MIARHPLGLVTLVASLGCGAINHPQNVGAHRAPANAPAGVLATGIWSAEMIGSPPDHLRSPSTPHRPWAFQVSVEPVRDSASFAFIFTRSDARVSHAGTVDPQLSVTGRGSTTRWRSRPEELWIDDDEMTFRLRNAMGWQNVRCRLKYAPAAATWDGTCLGEDGLKAVTLTLAVPRAKPSSGA
jgi:hypothetical protein